VDDLIVLITEKKGLGLREGGREREGMNNQEGEIVHKWE